MNRLKRKSIKGKYRKQKRQNPYARIDWDKATELFKQPINLQNENKLFPSTKKILRILAAAGAIGLTFAFPKAGVTIGSLLLKDEDYTGWRSDQIISQLKKQKYVSIKYNDNGSVTVKITKDGMNRALTYQLDTMMVRKPKHWDKKWRVVIFDIPEKYRRVRDIFRSRLRQLSLYQLQESVYISPYPCFNEVEFLRELYGISFTVSYLLVDRIEDDELLRSHFELS